MSEISRDAVLKAVTRFYLESRDFNGIPIGTLAAQFDAKGRKLHGVLRRLIEEEEIGLLYSDIHLNPHIIRTGFEPKEKQIARLDADNLEHTCVYPRPKYLEQVVDRSQYDGEPYTLCLALGEAQLAYRSFDLSVLEIYRNDPRYLYESSDVNGFISVKDEYFESSHMAESDQILLESFGFSYDSDLNRAVAVYVRYLADLSPEHQQIWKAKEITGDYRLHPDYYRNTIIGDWGERVPIFDAFLKEMYLINQMAEAMGRPRFFRKDFGEYGDSKPQKFGFLVRPTLEEFNSFVLLLDKMLSDNIDKRFFQKEVPEEIETKRADGKVVVQNKGTLQMLDEWMRKYFRTSDWEPWNESIAALREVRKLRQKPAHSMDENSFDQQYFKKQRELIVKSYSAVRTLRMLLENHTAVRAADIDVPDWLRNGEIWTY